MPDTDLDELRGRLLRSGLAPRYVERAILELGDHFADLEREAVGRGAATAAALSEARDRIGPSETIARQYENHSVLKRWSYRHPQLAMILYPVAYCMMLPAVPIHAGIENAPLLGRWLASLALAAIATSIMLLAMYMPIGISGAG